MINEKTIQSKINLGRFDKDSHFQLPREEFNNLRSKKSTTGWR